MIRISEERYNYYKNLIDKRVYVPWEEFTKLEVGDTLITNVYDYHDKLVGIKEIKINEIERDFSKDYEGNVIEEGHLSGEFRVKDLYGKKFTVKNTPKGVPLIKGSVSGVFSVNIDDVEYEMTSETMAERLIKAALSYVKDTNIDCNNFESYLRNVIK